MCSILFWKCYFYLENTKQYFILHLKVLFCSILYSIFKILRRHVIIVTEYFLKTTFYNREVRCLLTCWNCLTAVCYPHKSVCPMAELYKKVKVKVPHTRLQSVGFQSWYRFLAVSLQVTWVINPTIGCHYFPPGLQLPPQSLRGLQPVLLLGEQRHDGCEQFA